MSLISNERDTYEQMWQFDAYGENSPGERYADLFMEMSKAKPGDRVLDAGCGNGKGSLALVSRGFVPTMCDITPLGLLPEARKFKFHEVILWNDFTWQVGLQDWVYCCDVMEHLPLPFTMLAVSRMLDVAENGVFLSIYLEPDVFGAMIGKPLHQSVQSFVQWRNQLAAIGRVVECRDLGNVGIYMVTSGNR
jgi:SAM-dependent methyltransferase